MSVTLKEIAEASQVSISTASRALNGHPGINATTAKRVRNAADQLNYKTRRLNVSQGTLEGTDVGILCLGMGDSLTALPTVSATIGGAESSLAAAGARAVFASIPNLESPPDGLLARLPDTLILVSAMQRDVIGKMKAGFVEELRSRPTVWLLGRPTDAWGGMVGSNDYEVGAMAARALLDAGHRHLAFVNPKPNHILFQRREDGFRAAARRGGAESIVSLSKSPRVGWDYPAQIPRNVEAVQALIDEAIEMPEDRRPTGLFAAADSVAVLVYRALTIRGRTVGRDFSLVSGNNDATLIAGLHPRLATCDVSAFSIGQQAVRQLSMRLRYGSEMPDTETLLPPKFVPGESLQQLSDWKEREDAQVRSNIRM